MGSLGCLNPGLSSKLRLNTVKIGQLAAKTVPKPSLSNRPRSAPTGPSDAPTVAARMRVMARRRILAARRATHNIEGGEPKRRQFGV